MDNTKEEIKHIIDEFKDEQFLIHIRNILVAAKRLDKNREYN